MRNRRYILTALAIAVFVGVSATRTWADTASTQEYKVKAAFLYNFIKFVDWPKQSMGEPNQPITLGIVGKDPFAKAFEPVKHKPIKSRKVVIKRFKSAAELRKAGKSKEELDEHLEPLKRCHLLFVCASEKDCLKDITGTVKGLPVLTVSDTAQFLQSGGIINFVMDKQKVRFEINVAAAKKAKLQVRSQLLRLAKKVLNEEPRSK